MNFPNTGAALYSVRYSLCNNLYISFFVPWWQQNKLKTQHRHWHVPLCYEHSLTNTSSLHRTSLSIILSVDGNLRKWSNVSVSILAGWYTFCTIGVIFTVQATYLWLRLNVQYVISATRVLSLKTIQKRHGSTPQIHSRDTADRADPGQCWWFCHRKTVPTREHQHNKVVNTSADTPCSNLLKHSRSTIIKEKLRKNLQKSITTNR